MPKQPNQSTALSMQRMTTMPFPTVNRSVIEFFEHRRNRLAIVKTTRTPSGQVLDWIPIESQAPGDKIATPPPAVEKRRSCHPAIDAISTDVSFELETFGADRGPEGTVPILRPRFSLLEGISETVRKRKVDGRRFSERRDPPPAPDLTRYYHATASAYSSCYGCLSALSLWDPQCELDRDHSISQFGIQNYDNPQLQSIEAGCICSKAQFGDNLLHLFTYYTNNAYNVEGDNLGGYNANYRGWVQTHPHIFPGAVISAVDWPGFPGYEMEISFDLHDGNWWFYVGRTPIGYYPGSLFAGAHGKTLADHGSWCGFWGEVYSDKTDPSKTTTSMGSGLHAKYGWPFAAYQRDMLINTTVPGRVDILSLSSKSPALSTSVENAALYDIELAGSPFDGFMFFGGSGTGTPGVVAYPAPFF